jgi:hypothetical protein
LGCEDCMSLAEKIHENRPVERVQAECGECGYELFDSRKSKEDWFGVWASIISIEARSHRELTEHDDLQVDIDKQPKVKREMECTVTVNG